MAVLTLGVLIVINLVFCFLSSYSIAAYLITNGVILLLGALIYRNIFNSRV